MGCSIVMLDRSHDVKSFNCSAPVLNVWLNKTARQHQKKRLSSTFVLVDDAEPATVVGFYALSMRSMTARQTLPKTMTKILPMNVPGITLARLAVSYLEQNKGNGVRLLVDAMWRAKAVSKQIGGSFLFVDVKNTVLADFYIRYGFAALPDDPLTLCMPITDFP